MGEELHDGAGAPTLPESFQAEQRRERRDAAEHRQQILAAARRLFAKQGVEAVSMRQIALAAGIGQGTLYRRYANKGELCADLFGAWRERFASEVATLLAEMSSEPALTRLDAVLACMVQFQEEHTREMGCHEGAGPHEGLRYQPDFEGQMAMRRTPWYSWLHDLMVSLFAEAVARGELPPLDVAFTADAILSTLHPTAYRFQRYDRGFSPERILQGVRRLYVEGLRGNR